MIRPTPFPPLRARMIPPDDSRHARAGYTVFDILVFVAGFGAASWLSSYFDGAARIWVFWTSAIPFGMILWCFIFVWLLPLLEPRRRTDARPNDHDKPNVA